MIPRLIAIDPIGCGCTECLTGEYVPLEMATADQMRAMLMGTVRDHTEELFCYYKGKLTCGHMEWEINDAL